MRGALATPMNMNTRIAALFGIVLLVSTAGCAREAAPSATKGASAAKEAPASKAMTTAPTDESHSLKADRALVVTAEVTVRVAKVDAAIANIRDVVDTEGGYVGKANVQGERDEASATMDLRIPVARAAAVRKMLRTLGEVTSENESVDDVTEQRADLSARLNNSRNEERRMLDLMEHRSGDISQVIAAEKELSRVRETIERLEAEERTMAGEIAFATIHVTVQTIPAAVVVPEETPGHSIARAWTSGVHAAGSLVLALTIGVAATAPTLVPLALIAIAAIVIARRRRVRSVA